MTTKTIAVRLTTSSPTLVAAGPPARNLIETLDFIPGNSLRGLLARRYLDRSGSAEDDDFKNLFLSGEVRFGFAYPQGWRVIPLSARSCKYHKGFRKDGNHGVVDLLLEEPDKEITCQHQTQNQTCNRDVDYFAGYWDPRRVEKVEVARRLITRTAIAADLGTAQQGQLYSQRVIAENQAFQAEIEVPDPWHSTIEALLSDSFTAAIGTGRSRGQGWVRVERVPEKKPQLGQVDQRFKAFEQKAGTALLAVTLLSDAIFQDKYLRDLTAPLLSHLEPLGIKPDDWQPYDPGDNSFQAFAAHRQVFGFDGTPLCLPRQPRLAVKAGSVFPFKAKIDNPSIPKHGDGLGWIGERQGEGFGRALLWHPFHLDPEKEIKL